MRIVKVNKGKLWLRDDEIEGFLERIKTIQEINDAFSKKMGCIECCAVVTRPSGESSRRSSRRKEYKQLFIQGGYEQHPDAVN